MQQNTTTAPLHMQEEWRPAPEWEDWYEVSSRGRVRRVQGRNSGRLLRHHLHQGYVFVGLCRPGCYVFRRVHRLVALAFLGPCPPGMEVHHKDNNKANPCVSNLVYVSHRENMRLARLDGRLSSPRRVRRHIKLTPEQVRKIRASPRHHGTLQWEYGVTAEYILRIRRGKVWKDTDDIA